jgi:hypothetical protein
MNLPEVGRYAMYANILRAGKGTFASCNAGCSASETRVNTLMARALES